MKQSFIIRSALQKKYACEAINNLLEDASNPLWMVRIIKYAKNRTLEQNRLVHKLFSIIAEDTGNTPEFIKIFLKERLLSPVIVEGTINGEVIPKYSLPETSRMTTKELSEFVEKIYAWAHELDIPLPHPIDLRD